MVFLLVVLTILIAVTVDAVRLRRRRRAPAPLPHRALRAELPAGLFLHRGHGWVQVNTDGTVDIGVDALVRDLVGPPERVATIPVGSQLLEGGPMLRLEHRGRSLSVPAPVSGRVEVANPQLHGDLEAWAGEGTRGWAYTLRPSRLGAEVTGLRIGEQAATWLRQQRRRLSEWLVHNAVASSPAPTLPDGGEPVCGALRHLPTGAWADFERRFLNLSGGQGAAAEAGARR